MTDPRIWTPAHRLRRPTDVEVRIGSRWESSDGKVWKVVDSFQGDHHFRIQQENAENPDEPIVVSRSNFDRGGLEGGPLKLYKGQ